MFTYGEVKVKEGTQMHSEVKKVNRDKTKIVMSQAEVGIQVIRYRRYRNIRQGVVSENTE